MTEDLVKIKSDNPAHPKGFYIQFRNRMSPGDIEYIEGVNTAQPEAAEAVKTQPKPIKKRKKT